MAVDKKELLNWMYLNAAEEETKAEARKALADRNAALSTWATIILGLLACGSWFLTCRFTNEEVFQDGKREANEQVKNFVENAMKDE